MHFLRSILSAAAVAVSFSTLAEAKVKHAGINLEGWAADVSIFGSAYSTFVSSNCNASGAAQPYVESDFPEHYADWQAKGMNLFRINLAWQHAQVSLGGPLNETTMASIDKSIAQITTNGSTAILDIHNYARWYCAVIGQPSVSFPPTATVVTNEHFADLWSKLAARYKDNKKVIFELMNEPHDLIVQSWAVTVQAAVDAIRKTGATQKILVPGTQYARLTNYKVSSQPYVGPGKIKDPLNKLVTDVHNYFDDSIGLIGFCEPWDTTYLPVWEDFTQHHRAHGAKAILTEFGGNAFYTQCHEMIGQLLDYMDANSDVWYGWTVWGAYNPGVDYITLENDYTKPLTDVILAHAPNKPVTTTSTTKPTTILPTLKPTTTKL